jgi:hypothetical protein
MTFLIELVPLNMNVVVHLLSGVRYTSSLALFGVMEPQPRLYVKDLQWLSGNEQLFKISSCSTLENHLYYKNEVYRNTFVNFNG